MQCRVPCREERSGDLNRDDAIKIPFPPMSKSFKKKRFLINFLILISDLDFHRLINPKRRRRSSLSFFRYLLFFFLFVLVLFFFFFLFFCLLTASLRALIVAQVVSLSLSRHDFVCSSLSLLVVVISSLISLLALVFLFYVSLIPIIILHSYIDP